jgi:hypothetical protein
MIASTTTDRQTTSLRKVWRASILVCLSWLWVQCFNDNSQSTSAWTAWVQWFCLSLHWQRKSGNSLAMHPSSSTRTESGSPLWQADVNNDSVLTWIIIDVANWCLFLLWSDSFSVKRQGDLKSLSRYMMT